MQLRTAEAKLRLVPYCSRGEGHGGACRLHANCVGGACLLRMNGTQQTGNLDPGQP